MHKKRKERIGEKVNKIAAENEMISNLRENVISDD